MRTMAELKDIARQVVRMIDDAHPGCGAIQIIFDARGRGDRPVAMHLHGINEEDAIRQLQTLLATLIEAYERGDGAPGDIAPSKPLIVKPS